MLRTDRLREIRELRGYSQRRFARICGLSNNQMNRYELGLTDPSTAILTKIAKELDVSTDYLLGLSDHPSGYKGGDLPPDERRLLDAYTLADGNTMFKLMYERLKQAENSSQPDEA